MTAARKEAMISKLIEEIRKKNAPVVVGLDPQMSFIPEQLLKDAARHVEDATYDEDLGTAAEAVWRFNKEIVDAVADLVPAVKPQIAMYEQFGIPGMIAYWKTVRYCQEKGPSSGECQDIKTEAGRHRYEVVGEKVREWGEQSMDGAYSNVGAVVGATYPEQAKVLRELMPHTFILAPGYGAQGATA